MTFDTSAAQTI
jgi:hypothetical protein